MILWHIAPAAQRDAVAAEGILPGASPGDGPRPFGSYLWQSRTGLRWWIAQMYREGRASVQSPVDVWEVEADGLPIEADPQLNSRGAYMVPAGVPPDRLRLLTP